MLGGAKGGIQSEVEVLIPYSAVGLENPIRFVDVLCSIPEELLLLFRVRGRPARRAGL
jgi:hypothetical protein